jgi:anti-sigma factor RsiW
MEMINRHNYENWLMLYLDNELTATERRAVEDFVGLHPEVQQELISLKEVILQADVPANMPGKERLLMPQIWHEESLTRQQEQMLMMAEKTLPAAETTLLQKEIGQSPLLQKEWNLLQKTILTSSVPDEMPGKETLYRKEKTRVVLLNRVYRMAAAAAVLAFGLFFAAKMLNNNLTPGTPDVANVEKPVILLPATPEKSNLQENEMAALEDDLAETEENKRQTPPESSQVKNSRDAISVIANREVALEKGMQTTPGLEKQERVEVIRDMAIATPAQTIDIDGVDAVLPVSPHEPANAITVSLQEKSQNRAYEILELDDFDEEDTINIAGARISKQKVRGIYRNLTRPLARSLDKNAPKVNETK